MEELTLPVIPPGYGVLGLITILMVTWIKLKPALAKIRSEDEMSLRGDLMTRVRELEASLAEERRECAEKLEASQKAFDNRLSVMQESYEKKIGDLENKVEQYLAALLATKDRALKE